MGAIRILLVVTVECVPIFESVIVGGVFDFMVELDI